ncbi:unnamed protein product [Dovyalis caffra]|uniref:Heme O synthase n=1 Tax=Dovyalis caffra TaxID=77055 RepID=A0AAV1SCY8_9ROSI|nr:unnamed protein product [Dovyalis caffra]
MACLNICKEEGSAQGKPMKKEQEVCTRDGSVDRHGDPAIRGRTGTWFAGILILVNQGLATLAFFGVGVNLVLFLTRVLGQDNADAANNVSKWTGTVYIFSLLGAFLSDSYWGRYKTCAIFQAIFVTGLASLSLTSYLFLLKPRGCGDEQTPCGSHSTYQKAFFYFSIYLVALGNGGYQPNIATFGADQFDEGDAEEGYSKIAFFSYFYLALNLGSLFSNTILGYFEDHGMWALGFWASAGSALLALVLFLVGTPRYRHFTPQGNPLCRFCQVMVAAARKWKVQRVPNQDDLFELEGSKDSSKNGERRIQHTQGFRFLDRAAIKDYTEDENDIYNPWRVCPVNQVEEVKCILRLLPIWLCTILYSVVFTQMASLFVEQGAAMKTTISKFHIPPASMSSFDILSVAAFIFIYRRVLDPFVAGIRKDPKGLTELQRMGIGLVIAIIAMVSAGVVELLRLKYAKKECPNCESASSLSIFWQIPQYVLIGASEVFMYVGQLEFFNGQAPDGLKSFGSALCMTSISLGNYVSSLLVTIVMKVSTRDKMPGWIPGNLNKGHLDRFYFLLAALTTADLIVYIICAKWYKYIKFEGNQQRNLGGESKLSNEEADLKVELEKLSDFPKRKSQHFPSVEMWRNTSKLLSNPNYHHNRLNSSLSDFSGNGFVFGPQSLLTHYYSSPQSATSDSLKLGISNHKSDGIRAFSSSSAAAPAVVDALSPLASAVQLARHYSSCYWELSKARLSMLVVATSGTGYVLGSAGSAVDLAGLGWTCAGTMMVAASANSLNQVFEKNNDAKMKRTRQRPLPSGRLTIPHALSWAVSVGVAGTAILACKANMLAAGLGASNLFLYAFVYTPLKQIHPVNTWVGAVVGAIPPLMG